MSTSDIATKSTNATAAVMSSLRFAQSNPDIGVVLTTQSGSRYLLVWHEDRLIGNKKRAGEGREIKPGSWFPVGGLDDVRSFNIWGSLKIGPWTTTKVRRVELKQREKGGESSLFTVFEV